MSTRQSHRAPPPAPRQPILLRYVALGGLIGLALFVGAAFLGWSLA